MKNFITVNDIGNLESAISKALEIKKNPFAEQYLGKNKTLGLVFLNPSLRTRISSQKAAQNLGMNCIVINAGQDSWTWEFGENALMDGNTVEHIKDAARVLSEYCDIIGIRCFADFKNKEDDVNEKVITQFIKYATVPVVSLESATRHPLQSFADMLTIKENWHFDKLSEHRKPKIVLTWAPHIKPIAHAVGNSFAEWAQELDADFVIANPKGYNLDKNFTKDVPVFHNQDEALKDADFVYVKNWSSFEDYGQTPEVEGDWLLSEEKMKLTNNGKVMHCLPVRRNVEVTDEILDHHSLIYEEANNRTYSMQYVLSEILKELNEK